MDAKRLAKIPLFAELPRRDRERVARWADEIDVPSGYRLVDEGRFPHEFFVIEEGTVEVIKGGHHLANLGPGDFFGEIALVERDRRTATVTAITPVTAIVMHGRDFDAMRSGFPQIAQRIHDAVHARSPRHDRDEG